MLDEVNVIEGERKLVGTPQMKSLELKKIGPREL